MFCEKKWITACKVSITAEVHNVGDCLSGWSLQNQGTFCYQTWYGDAAPQARVSCGKKLFAVFKVKVTYIFWTVDSSATMLSLMIHHRKPEYLLHSRSRSQQKVRMSVFVQMISSKWPNIFLPNLVMWCINLSWSVMQKDWYAIFKVKVTTKARMIKIWQFLLYFLKCWSICC